MKVHSVAGYLRPFQQRLVKSPSTGIPCRVEGGSRPFGSSCSGGGAGIGNVQDRLLPSSVSQSRTTPFIKDPKTVSVIGAPMTFGQPYTGTDDTPSLLRKAGLRSMLTRLGWRVKDNPDLDHSYENLSSVHTNNATNVRINPQEHHQQQQQQNAKNSILVGAGAHLICEAVKEACQQGQFPLILGGDHSISLGSLSGILQMRPNTGILWIDAHADLHTPATSETGNMHGMPLGMLMDGISYDPSTLPGFEWWWEDDPQNKKRLLHPKDLVYVGLRDVDAAERKAIKQLGIKAFTMYDIDHYGIGRVMDMALDHLLSSGPRPIHLSWDIDSVDPLHAPATGTAVRGGLTYREAHYVCESVAASGALASADIVELNPTLSDEHGGDLTVDLGIQLITSLMGKSII
jgi:arginase